MIVPAEAAETTILTQVLAPDQPDLSSLGGFCSVVPAACGYPWLMYWILAAAFLYVAIAVPRLRPVAIAGFVVLSLLLGWGMVQRWRGPDPASPAVVQERGRPSSPAAQLGSVPVESVRLDGMRLTGGGAPFELHGRITNETRDMLLKTITIRLTRLDCYEGALDPSGCEPIWQEQHWTTVSVPPQQSREFASSIWRRGGAPRARGTVHDRFEIVAATGEAAVPVEAAGSGNQDEIPADTATGGTGAPERG